MYLEDINGKGDLSQWEASISSNVSVLEGDIISQNITYKLGNASSPNAYSSSKVLYRVFFELTRGIRSLYTLPERFVRRRFQRNRLSAFRIISELTNHLEPYLIARTIQIEYRIPPFLQV